jgi:hypothetical protein
VEAHSNWQNNGLFVSTRKQVIKDALIAPLSDYHTNVLGPNGEIVEDPQIAIERLYISSYCYISRESFLMQSLSAYIMLENDSCNSLPSPTLETSKRA